MKKEKVTEAATGTRSVISQLRESGVRQSKLSPTEVQRGMGKVGDTLLRLGLSPS